MPSPKVIRHKAVGEFIAQVVTYTDRGEFMSSLQIYKVSADGLSTSLEGETIWLQENAKKYFEVACSGLRGEIEGNSEIHIGRIIDYINHNAVTLLAEDNQGGF